MSTENDFNLDENLDLDADLNLSSVDNNEPNGLKNLSNLDVTISAEVGFTTMPIKEAEKMVSGTVIMLNKTVGDLVDVKINGTLIGQGQVVEKNGRYGVKITSLNAN